MPVPVKPKSLTVLLAGGGTLGSVSPLLAVIERARQQKRPWTFTFVGTRSGPERQLLEPFDVSYRPITGAKLRRYFSWHNGLLPFTLARAIGESIRILKKVKPDVVLAAGSFVAVPVAWAARMLHIPMVIYQMDVRPGLANRLIARVATHIVVAFRHHIYTFNRDKTTAIGMIARPSVLRARRAESLETLGLSTDRPVVLIVGGGTGAKALNHKVAAVAQQLTKRAQIIHITGAGKELPVTAPHYHQYAFLGELMPAALAAADVVVTRGGLATISELTALGKPSLIIPMPESHQEENAEFLRRHNAAAVLSQQGLTPQQLAKAIERLVTDFKLQKLFHENIKKLYEPDGLDHLLTIIDTTAR